MGWQDLHSSLCDANPEVVEFYQLLLSIISQSLLISAEVKRWRVEG
jgi:hypothetical protein